ncbi:MAG TPA: methyltransferase domain-containing protein [Planctomycetota bacterium]|nr:methyltransferase domain-containing protein [Planctomycetota bacterium]
MPELLSCPGCAGPLKNEGGALRCSCGAWPVVEGIPLLVPWALNRQFTVEEVLARHLPPPPGAVGRLLRRLFPGIGAIRDSLHGRDASFMELASLLMRPFELDYFRYRFSDLSYLASAAMLTPLSRGPVLDLGCGAGHLTGAVFRRIPKALVVGIDINFPLLYLAKRFVEPEAMYLCANAAGRLPFVDGAFEAAVCADMFKYLSDRGGAARELLRVTRGPVILSHFFDPSFREDGIAPIEPEACAALFSARSPRLYKESDILGNFLRKRELDLGAPGASTSDVASLTAGVDPRLYAGADYFVAGETINPIYETREEGDRIHLTRRVLSERHTAAFRAHPELLPETLTLTREQVVNRDPELVRQFVLLELPPNYL